MKKMNKDKVLNILVTVFSILIVLCFFPVIGGCLNYGHTAESFYTWAGIVYIVSIVGNIVCNVIQNREEDKKKEIK